MTKIVLCYAVFFVCFIVRFPPSTARNGAAAEVPTAQTPPLQSRSGSSAIVVIAASTNDDDDENYKPKHHHDHKKPGSPLISLTINDKDLVLPHKARHEVHTPDSYAANNPTPPLSYQAPVPHKHKSSTGYAFVDLLKSLLGVSSSAAAHHEHKKVNTGEDFYYQRRPQHSAPYEPPPTVVNPPITTIRTYDTPAQSPKVEYEEKYHDYLPPAKPEYEEKYHDFLPPESAAATAPLVSYIRKSAPASVVIYPTKTTSYQSPKPYEPLYVTKIHTKYVHDTVVKPPVTQYHTNYQTVFVPTVSTYVPPPQTYTHTEIAYLTKTVTAEHNPHTYGDGDNDEEDDEEHHHALPAPSEAPYVPQQQPQAAYGIPLSQPKPYMIPYDAAPRY